MRQVRTRNAMHCGCRIFKMAAKVEKFPLLYALYFDRHSSFLRKLQEYPTEPLDKIPARQAEFELAGKKNIG